MRKHQFLMLLHAMVQAGDAVARHWMDRMYGTGWKLCKVVGGRE